MALLRSRVALSIVTASVGLTIATTLPAQAAGYDVTWNRVQSYPNSFAYAYTTTNCTGASVTLANVGTYFARNVQSTRSPSYYTEFYKDGGGTYRIANGTCFRVPGTGVLQGFNPALPAG